VPAAAVIPALVAYINTVVVKTLVVDLRSVSLCSVLVHFLKPLCYNAGFGCGSRTLGETLPSGRYRERLLAVHSLPIYW
jgi:hypothetical protein